MQKLKIALVLDDSLDTPDGVQQYVLAVGRWLSQEGHSVHYLVGHTTRTDIKHIHSLGRNVQVRFNQNRMSIPLPVSKRAIADLFRKEQFDVIHVQMPYSPMLGERVIMAAPQHAAVIGTFHVVPHSRLVLEANRALSILLGRSLKRFDRVIAVSDQAALLAKKTFRQDSVVVPNTIDLEPFYRAKSFPEFDHTRTVVFLGRLVPRKGAAYLLDAVNYIERHQLIEDSKWRVLVCGKGPLANELAMYIQKHHLQDRVTLTGFVDEVDKPRFLASADVVVFPSTGGESFGIVLIEGFAAARGVVLGGNNPGYAAVLRDHPENLFDPKNTKGFADILVRNLRSAELRQKARAWQQVAGRQYDIPVVGKQILAVYSSALRKRRK